MKKVKHIILAIIIIFNCLILSGLTFVFVLINRDSEKTEEANIAEQNEMQTKAGKETKYEIIDGKLYGWGWNDWGQLGQGTVEDIRKFMVPDPNGIPFQIVLPWCRWGSQVSCLLRRSYC